MITMYLENIVDKEKSIGIETDDGKWIADVILESEKVCVEVNSVSELFADENDYRAYKQSRNKI